MAPGQVVFDVGASFGNWSLTALSIEPSLSLFCFELVQTVFPQLCENLKPFTEHIYNVALSNHAGSSIFYHFDLEKSEGSSLYYREHFRPYGQYVKAITVDLWTLDEFCRDHSVSQIDFLKIDTEGSELAILQGASTLLASHQIRALQFEYGGTYPDAKITLREVVQLLTESGYLVFRLSENRLIHISNWKPSLENQQYANYFAILQSEMPALTLTTRLI